jgi:hypothetical protein
MKYGPNYFISNYTKRHKIRILTFVIDRDDQNFVCNLRMKLIHQIDSSAGRLSCTLPEVRASPSPIL